MLKLIVTGVDISKAGRDAAVLACALAAGDDAEVLLTGVWRESLLPFPLLLGSQVHPLEDVEQMLLRTRADYAPQAVTRPLSSLSPARALRRTAQDEHAGMIVLGSAASAPHGRVHVGRDARQVLHDASVPVAIAAHGLHDGPCSIRRIVVGIDGGREADAALTLAAELAGSLGADLHAVAVLDERLPLTFGPGGGGLALLGSEEVVSRQREAAEAVVERARATPGVRAAELRLGDPDTELARAAAEADLVVVGSRHWGRPSRVVLGSVAERLVRDAPCSLLLVPRPADTAAAGT